MAEHDPNQKTLSPARLNGGKPLIRDDRAYMGLTPKQWAYCEARARGKGIVDAYREAYKPHEKLPKESLYAMSSAIEANIKIQARIRARLLELQGDVSSLPVIGREFVVTGIASLAIGGEKESTRLKGYELLGKALGLFDRGPEKTEAPKTVDDVDAKLKDLLRAAIKGSGPVIDAEVLEPLGPDAPLAEPGRDRRRKPKAAPDTDEL